MCPPRDNGQPGSATPWLTHIATLAGVLREGANVYKDRLARVRCSRNDRCPKWLPRVKADEIRSSGESRYSILHLYRGAKASAGYLHPVICQVPARGLVRISTQEETCP